MFILNCCYAEKSWLMHNHLRFCADRGRNALILCSASFYLGMGGFGAQAFGWICCAGRRWGAEFCFSSLCALLAQPLIF
tara:strand:- start:369 stop:605 length:237 start_codon:yes stop_codon:yes gene_type:complete